MSCNTVRNEEIKVFKIFYNDGIISCIDLTSFSEAYLSIYCDARGDNSGFRTFITVGYTDKLEARANLSLEGSFEPFL
jgi:hypothetical protein